MITKLDHLYGAAGDVSALENKVNNLSQIAVKNNLTNQQLPQQKITQEPTDRQHIIRLGDTQYVRIVNQTTALTNPNNVWEFTPSTPFTNQRIHSFIIKVGVSGVDYIFNCSGWIQSKTYKNMFPVFTLAKDNNFNESAKIKFWIEQEKVKMLSTVSADVIQIYMRLENHR